MTKRGRPKPLSQMRRTLRALWRGLPGNPCSYSSAHWSRRPRHREQTGNEIQGARPLLPPPKSIFQRPTVGLATEEYTHVHVLRFAQEHQG